ncbi:MAG TPA: hypothetical protein VD907_01860 [Verrucomicrobiae bacterium]|nr:hypothetical protein [Verrucomicrobiae bacterium]
MLIHTRRTEADGRVAFEKDQLYTLVMQFFAEEVNWELRHGRKAKIISLNLREVVSGWDNQRLVYSLAGDTAKDEETFAIMLKSLIGFIRYNPEVFDISEQAEMFMAAYSWE